MRTSFRPTSLLAATVLGGLLLTAPGTGAAVAAAPADATHTATVRSAAPSDAAERARPCSRRDFQPSIRNVRRTKVTGGIYRLETVNYPVRTKITRSYRVRTSKSATLRAGVSARLSSEVSAGGTLAKVVSIDAKISGEVGMTTEIETTNTKSYTVQSKTEQWVPANTRIAWFAGAKSVRGTFQYSKCDAIAGDDPNGGVVRWMSATWSTYGLPESGGIRCDQRPTGYILKFAKAAGCS